MNVTVFVCFHVVSHCQCGAGGREDLSLDQDEEVQCESVRVHVTLDTVDKFTAWYCLKLPLALEQLSSLPFGLVRVSATVP